MTDRRTWWRTRWPVVALVAVVLAGAGLLAGSAFEGSLTYYTTPSELDPAPEDDDVRLGGLVVVGSVQREAGTLRFTLTDGAADIQVVSGDVPPDTFREGQGAVVQGRVGPDGVFEAEQVIVRHSNQYQPSEVLEQ